MKLHRRTLSKNGFTLVELLAVLAISAIIMTFLVGITVTGMKSYKQQNEVKTLRENANLVMTKISNIFYQENGQPTIIIKNGGIYFSTNTVPITDPHLNYQGSSCSPSKPLDPTQPNNGNMTCTPNSEKTLNITLKVRPTGAYRNKLQFTTQSTFNYPW